MAVKIQPLSDRVLVAPQEAETKTASGKGKKDHEMTVKNGDTVLYGKCSGTELKFEGKDYLIMREDDILAII